MELIYILIAYVQTLSISLGVGCSTVAVINYIVALRDGTIDNSERSIMGATYILLRISMGLILLTLIFQALFHFVEFGYSYLQSFVLSVWTVVFILYINAVLMTKHLIPGVIGPGVQAATWYMLGTLLFFSSTQLTGFTYTTYMIIYVIFIILSISLIYIAVLRTKRSAKTTSQTPQTM